MKINLALTFGDALATSCEDLSAHLSRLYASQVLLGPAALPHISVIQTECDEAEVDDIWSAAQTVMQREYSLTFAGLTLVPDRVGVTWIEIQVLKNEALLKLQQTLLGLAAFHNRTVYNGTGDAYRPHVTVALIESDIHELPLPYPLLRETGVVGIPSLGLVGEHYVFAKSLRTMP